MDVQSWTAIFVGIVAFSFLLQSVAIFGMYTRLKQVTTRLEELSADVKKKLADVSENVHQSLEAAKPILGGIQRLNETLLAVSDLVRHRAVDLDKFAQETTDTLRAQLVRVDDVVDSTTARVHHVVDTWHHSVVEPTHELTALIKAFKAGINYFLARREVRHSRRSQPDEELFI